MPLDSQTAAETDIKNEICGHAQAAPGNAAVASSPTQVSAPVNGNGVQAAQHREIDHLAPLPQRKPRSRWWLDALLALLLCLAAFPIRWAETRGDFWFDEADYAQAAVRGIEANRWDRSDDPAQPLKLVRFRHYHPPLVAQVMAAALPWGRGERTLRVPFVLAGCATIGVVYLCGLSLFRRRFRGGNEPLRGVAVACAVISLFTPALIRSASHGIPWAWITLWLALLLLTLLRYSATHRAGWLIAAGGVLGLLFVTSEYLFPTLVIAAAALAWIVWRGNEHGERPGWKNVAGGLFGAGALFAVIGAALWPAGFTGGAVEMLKHYVEMADTSAFPVVINGVSYQQAPKWAYLYWYWTQFPLYLALYAAGVIGALVLAARRRFDAASGLVALFIVAMLAVAHRAHIIGPEYLSHVLPFLTLLGGIPLAALARRQPAHTLPLLAAICCVLAMAPQVQPMAGMEPRAQLSRWPEAARFLTEQWTPGDVLLASQYGVAARWYVRHVGGAPATDEQIGILPAYDAKNEVLRMLLYGQCKWVAVGNSFGDWAPVDNRIRLVLRSWPVVWRSKESGEPGTEEPSRLVIHQRPAGISPKRPQPSPWVPQNPGGWPDEWLPW